MANLRTCTACKTEKELQMFHRDNSSKSGYVYRCKDCLKSKYNLYYSERYAKDKPKYKARQKVYRKNNPEKVARSIKNSTLKRKYGLNLEDLERMKSEQGGLCAVVGCPNTAQFVDHCHTTGAVRGLLCCGCNTALGMLNEDIGRIIGLAGYLHTHNKKGV